MLDRRCCVMGAGLDLFSRAAFSQTVQTSGTDSDATGLGCRYEVTPKNPPNDGILFVDNSPEGRSGHLGHALVEYEDSKILPFYPNCSAEIHNPKKPSKGHSAAVWMEDTHGASRQRCAVIEEGCTMHGITTERYSCCTSRTTTRSISWATSPSMCMSYM